MTLKEFIVDVLKGNNLDYDPEDVEKIITNQAREMAKDNCIAISDEDVKSMILDYPNLKNKQEESKPQPQPKLEPVKEKQTEVPKEDKPEQTNLFGWAEV